jgi:hypothetical protein
VRPRARAISLELLWDRVDEGRPGGIATQLEIIKRGTQFEEVRALAGRPAGVKHGRVHPQPLDADGKTTAQHRGAQGRRAKHLSFTNDGHVSPAADTGDRAQQTNDSA